MKNNQRTTRDVSVIDCVTPYVTITRKSQSLPLKFEITFFIPTFAEIKMFYCFSDISEDSFMEQ